MAIQYGRGIAAPFYPSVRLSLQVNAAIMHTNQTGKTVVYLSFYQGDHIPWYDGNGTWWRINMGASVSNDLTASSVGHAGPAAAAVDSNYDLFYWVHSTLGQILTRGPVWSTSTSRGTGVSSTELTTIDGYFVNKYAISNGPAANVGLYMGTIRTNGSAQVDWQSGAISNGWTPGRFHVWNMFNRKEFASFNGDTTDTWDYNLSTIRAPNGNTTTALVSVVRGVNEDPIWASYGCGVKCTSSGSQGVVGVALDGVAAFGGRPGIAAAASSDIIQTPVGLYIEQFAGDGYHTINACEWASTTATTTFFGDNGSALLYKGGMHVVITA